MPMSVAARIEEKLTAALKPEAIEVVDESGKHAGHSGARPEGETHFRVMVVASAFEGMNRVARQRQVYDILSEEMSGQIHALALQTKTPAEAA